VPTIVLGFLGVESIAVAAFEARSHKDIVYPALWVHWIVYAMYFFVTVGIVVSVWWKNPELPSIFGNTIHGRDLNAVNATSSLPSHNTSSATILAMESLNSNLAGFVNACLIFSVMSAGNTAVYYSSRNLWGLTYNLQGQNHISRWFKKLTPLMASSGAPIWTIFFSWLLFFWLPWLQLVPSNTRVSID
jgi:amino acid transporter